MKTKNTKHKLSYILITLSFILTPFASFFVYVIDFRIGKHIGNYLITEITTVLLLILLVLWFMKSPNIKKRLQVLSVIIGTLFALLAIYGFLLLLFLNNSFRFTAMGYAMERDFSRKQERYIPIVTSVFDTALKKNVRHDFDTTYNQLITYPDQKIIIKHGKVDELFVSKGSRKPVYFIRLKDNKIEKLFQSGNIRYEIIDTDGEKTVRDMLLGKILPIQYPQHTCCGMDDVSWSDEVPFFRLFVPERRYLKDFYSELETILLIKDKYGNILGAMVDLHGD